MVDSKKNKLDKLMLLIRFVVKKVPRTVVDFIVIDLKLIPYSFLKKRKEALLSQM
jgi:hypothetical protein